MDETITITKKEYESLRADSKKLTYLEDYGVDNWQGYDDAMQLLSQDSVDNE